MDLELKRKLLFWYLVLKAKNGEIVMVSETYYSRSNALRAYRQVMKSLKIGGK